MGYNPLTGIYTPAAGALTATAGQTIASATWDGIFTDMTGAFSSLGPANLPYINGAQIARVFTKVQTVTFSVSAGDIATFAIASILPPSVTTYQVNALRIGNAKGNLNGATVSLYTGAAATGIIVITSTATTVATSVVGSTNSLQSMFGSATVMYNNAQLFLHITTSTATSNSANVSLEIIPVY